MPRVYREKKEVERKLIREFVKHLGYRVLKPNGSDTPDAILTLAKGNRRIRVAIEHTDYYIDAESGKPSRIADLDHLWRQV